MVVPEVLGSWEGLILISMKLAYTPFPSSWGSWRAMDKESLIRETPPLLLLSRFGHVRLCATPWTAAYQAPLSTGFSRQEYWSGLPFPSLGLEK